jgi:hypothetical protein
MVHVELVKAQTSEMLLTEGERPLGSDLASHADVVEAPHGRQRRRSHHPSLLQLPNLVGHELGGPALELKYPGEGLGCCGRCWHRVSLAALPNALLDQIRP